MAENILREMEKQMNEFKNYHPIVNFIYFIFIIGFTMFFMNPVCLCFSLLGGFTYSIMINGKKAIKTNIIYMLPAIILGAVMNPAFNHQGLTILLYLPSGNPLTLESILYGICASVMIVSVICWFSCYTAVMTSDKFVYLFGRIIPALSLVLSMILRFVPQFIQQTKKTAEARRCVGKDLSNGGIIQRAKNGLSVLSIMITWALENSIDTADSMKSRGYGLKGRTAFSIYRFDNRDKTALLIIGVLGLYILAGGFLDGMYFRYFPSIRWGGFSSYNLSVFIAYLILCFVPVIVEVWEELRWKSLKSGI